MVYTLAITKDFELLRLSAGDVVIIEPGAENPIVLYRPLPANFGAILGSLMEGVAEPLNPDASLAELAAVVGQSALYQPSPAGDGHAQARPAYAVRRPPHLTRLK